MVEREKKVMSRLTKEITAYGNTFIECNTESCQSWECLDCQHFEEMLAKLKHYEDMEEQGRLIEVKYATTVGESGICSQCGESYMDVADADAYQSGYIPNFCPWCGAIFVSEAKLKEMAGE